VSDLKFIAFVWEPANHAATIEAQWQIERARALAFSEDIALAGPGLAVLVDRAPGAPPPQILADGRGILLGRLFRKPGSHAEDPIPRMTTLNASEAQAVIATGGHALIEKYWGDYVTVFRAEVGAVQVLRSPFATLPCFRLRRGALYLYFSDLEDIAALIEAPWSIDWTALAQSFLGPQLPGRTHLKAIGELAPGHRERVLPIGACSAALWKPHEMACEAPLEDWYEAARALRTIARACIQARASEFPRIVMGLSGGLDSSITLACLAQTASSPAILALTQYLEDTDSDERQYAQLAAEHVGCALEAHRRDEVPDLRSAVHTRLLAVSPGLRMPAIDRIEPDVARRFGARAIFHGHGGDELFCRNHVSLYVADFLRTRGLRRELLSLAMHAAVTEGLTVWHVLGQALYDAFLRRHLDLTGLHRMHWQGRSLLRAAALGSPSGPEIAHFLDAGRVTSGRLWQIGILCARRSFTSPFDEAGDALHISPLLAQPLVELCLRIPTWFQARDRADRALTRCAFAADIPEAIQMRRDKGGAESVAAAILERNRAFCREMLLGGIVVESGIIDRVCLEGALAERPCERGVNSAPLFHLLGAEIWARAVSAPARKHQNRHRKVSPYEGYSSRP
jgi:asparagine synthase (glutamine-hydrolysing)